MGADKEIIIALEFGTSAIRGIAGKKKSDGSIQILDIEQERSTDAIQRGVIYNIDKTTQAITNIVNRLNERLNIQICRAYVGISGQSLHTAGNYISRGLETKVKITPELIDNLMDNNRNTQYTDSQILDVIPQEYVVGNRTIPDPVGVQTEQIEARFLNVVAKNTLIDNIHKCMRMANIEIADILISPLMLAESLLTDSEKRSGCAMVDFGAGTTTVAVYNGNLLRHLVVIPLGGNNITADLAKACQMDFEEAEAIKRKHAIAFVAAESEAPQQLSISNDRTLSENELQDIVGARQEEIIANVWHQISSMSGNLLSGIIITGGAAQLKDMPEAIKHFTQFPKVKVAKSLITTSDVGAGVTTPQGNSIDTLIALVLHGDMNCIRDAVEETLEEHPIEPEEEPTEEKNILSDTTEENGKNEKGVDPKPKKVSFSERWRIWGKKLTDIFEEKEDEENE